LLATFRFNCFLIELLIEVWSSFLVAIKITLI
jgi:hypothetical protein